MHKSTCQLLDKVLTETQNYRCEYLEVLIEKYVKTEDKSVEIDLRNLKQYKTTSYLKRIKEHNFGSVSSYNCTSAKKTISIWKKSVVIRKRDSFRRCVGAESYYEECNSDSVSFDENRKHQPSDQTVLSVQKHEPSSDESSSDKSSSDKSSSDEESEFTDKELSDDLFCKANPSFSSDFKKINSKKKQDKMLTENKTNNYLATNDKKSLSAKKEQTFSSFKNKNCDVNLLKFSNRKQLDILFENFSVFHSNNCDDKNRKIHYEKMFIHYKGISSAKKEKKKMDYIANRSVPPKFSFSEIGLGISVKNCQASSAYNLNSLPYSSKTSTVPSKLSFSETKMRISNENCHVSDACNAKLLHYASSKSTALPKFSFSEIGMGLSNKNNQASNVCNIKSFPCVSSKSTEPLKSSFTKIRTEISCKNSRTLPHSLSLKSASPLSSPSPNVGNSLDNFIPSVKKASILKKPSEKMAFLKQKTLPFRMSKCCNIYKDYHKNNVVEIDDLSLRKGSETHSQTNLSSK